ncbi:methyltransferase domain-containing protein [Nocardiopsis sp. CNR-923]|uniref:methyltransferase domain-containing protein n=1 Tax=Nocardiopsis sp. CNR-923 TaxID=1904965 RepID=UPI000A7AA46F|nr:methyltransferase domain-containing protein [Nocardiopsis sp. CNR-923]
MRVLEIGTGTGWNAAILASLVGPTGHVTSLEIDPDVAAHARDRLSGSGVRVVPGIEVPDDVVYDAVIATCAVSRVPPAWIEQARPEASIIVPWGSYSGSHASPVAALRKTGPQSAVGPFVCEAFFMRDRTQRVPVGEFPGMGRESETTRVVPFTPEDLVTDDRLVRFLLMLPGVRIGTGVRPFNGDRGRIVYMGAPDSSWAYLWPDGSVHGGGPTPLAERLRETHALLAREGWPGLDEFSLAVDTSGEECRVRTRFGTWEHRV